MFNWANQNFAPLYHRGAIPDHVRDRAIDTSATDHSRGHISMRMFLRLANAAPPQYGGPILSWIKGQNLRGWFTGDGMLTFHNQDLTQFEQNFWKNIDTYHRPELGRRHGARRVRHRRHAARYF
jgi:hypothetical protein